ncbi:MAG: acyltransferase family protein [Burkholderiaceae bacterium]
MAPQTIDGSDSMMRVLIWGTPALLLFGAVFNLSARGPVRRVLMLLGNASYSLYLSHLVVLRIAQEMIERWPPDIAPDTLLALLMTVCLSVGIAAWALLEKPLLAVTRRLLLGRPAGQATEPRQSVPSRLLEGRS